MCLISTEEPLPKVRRIESEEKNDDQPLKQGTDKAAVLQDALIQAADRERQLQMQVDKMKDDLTQLQKRLEHQSKDFDDFKQRNARLWEQEMKRRGGRFIWLKYLIVAVRRVRTVKPTTHDRSSAADDLCRHSDVILSADNLGRVSEC